MDLLYSKLYLKFKIPVLQIMKKFKCKPVGCFTGDGGGGSMLPDCGQSQWSAAASGHQGGVCLHTAQLERGLLSHSPKISFYALEIKDRGTYCFVRHSVIP